MKVEASITLYCLLRVLLELTFRHLAEAVRHEHSERVATEKSVDDLIGLAKVIIPYDMQHNAEIDACDLAMEIERLDLLENYVDANTYNRVCLYLTRYAR